MIARELLKRLRALRPRLSAGALAWAVLLIGLIFTGGVALNLRQVALNDDRERAEEAAARARVGLEREMHRHYEFLRSVAGLLKTEPVTQQEFSRYVASLSPGEVYPGSEAVLYVEGHGPRRLDVTRAAPAGALRELAGLAALAPPTDALARARDRARPALSARLPESAGAYRDDYVLFLPIFDGPADSVRERREALDGWIAAVLDRSFLTRVLTEFDPGPEVALELYEGDTPDPARRLSFSGAESAEGGETRTRSLDAYGQTFLLRGRTVSGLTSTRYGREALLVLVLGSLLSALLFTLVRVLSHSSTLALNLANDTVDRMLDLEERFSSLAATPVGIFRTDAQGSLVFGNGRWQELTGAEVDEEARAPWTRIIHPNSRRTVDAAWRAACRDRSEFGRQFRLARADEERWVACRLAPLAGGSARAGWVGSLEDVTAFHRQEEELARRALHDPLTELPNRSYFLDRLGQAIERSRRARARVAVLFVDLDGFKAVNDTIGHDGGDQMLVEVAHRLKGAVRGGDTVARYGGDEFTVLCEDVVTSDEMIAAAGRISEALAAVFEVDGREFSIDCSIGIAIGFGARTAAQELLRTADDAMYEAKSNGGSFRLVEDGRPGVHQV